MKITQTLSRCPIHTQIFSFLLVSLGIGIIIKQIAFIIAILISPSGWTSQPWTILFVQAFTTIGAFLLPSLWMNKIKETSVPDFLKRKKSFTPKLFLTFLFIYLILSPGISFLEEWAKDWTLPQRLAEYTLSMQKNTEIIFQTIFNTPSLWQFSGAIFVVAIIAGVCEEAFFRGCLQNLIQEWSKKKHLSIWVSAAIFSAAHMDITGFLPRLLLGAMLGYAYILSSSLWLPILLHIINNTIMCFILYGTYHNGFSDLTFTSALWLLPSLLIPILLIAMAWKRNYYTDPDKEK